jgi:CheY-like chemotaxis protein
VPHSATCPICLKAGFVRRETVKAGDTSRRRGYCGACDNSWPVSDSGHPLRAVSLRAEDHPKDSPDDPQTVLVIDDNDATRTVLVRLLVLRGYPTAAATNGREGLECLRADRSIGLVVLDLEMPEADGYWFREQQCSDPALAHVPLIVFTGSDAADVDVERLHGAIVLHKPVGIPHLLAMIATCVTQE